MVEVIHFQFEKGLPYRTQNLTEAEMDLNLMIEKHSNERAKPECLSTTETAVVSEVGMTREELCVYMVDSEEWRRKELLFGEVFPVVGDRMRFYEEFADRKFQEYARLGKPTDGLNALVIHKLAIDWWFSLLPKNLLDAYEKEGRRV